MAGDVFIGARVRRARAELGWTQQELADRVGVSKELIFGIENGRRSVSRATLGPLAYHLQLDISDLTAQPYRTGTRREDAVFAPITRIRRELASFGLEPTDGVPLPLDQLCKQVAAVSLARHGGDLMTVGHRMPDVLAALRVASCTYEGPERETVMGLYAQALFCLRQLLHAVGYRDLATGTVGPFFDAARASGDPRWLDLGNVFRAGDLDLAGDAAAASRLLDLTLERMGPDDTAPGRAMTAFLHFQAAFAHARSDEATAWAHYDEAGRLIRLLPGPEDTHGLAVSLTGWQIWGPAVAMSMGDGAAAVRLAEQVQFTPSTPMGRYAQSLIDGIGGLLILRRWDTATAQLEKVLRLAPQLGRHSVDVHASVEVILQHQRRVPGDISQLATTIGLLR